ncbi:MAG: acylphosphatase [PVC group bacterium]|nr:acylphosphatase [PVC group bacterium]
MSITQVHIYYSGRVHGVGFRYTAERIAASWGVAGWVRNLPDGRVELVAEAEKNKLKGFTEDLEATMHAYIRNTDVFWEDAEQVKGFTIRF